ncbi:FAD-dependent monooxygenase [Alphaproteobacteria bacterium KMM 3653]|uniref:FAD-dependent monooxygenase n=1 Tax=Harenicola maris TaxID=2841044 RepID=A0AAP2CK03_9RHOB|nr:FAD-dependent monooxygenase [Harenicola maris]
MTRAGLQRHAVIAGGGIGGLSAGLALSLLGWQVTVCERAKALEEVGAGLQISPNGVKLLERLGVMPALEPLLFEPEAIEMRLGESGRQIMYLPMKGAALARWGARYIQVHRADLVEVLAQALLARQGDALRLGCDVIGYAHREDGATARLADGGEIDADLVVGADGIHSAIREQMLGPEKPAFTGNVAWRALVPVEALGGLAPPPTGCIWAGPGKHAVTTRVRGGSLVNFVGIVEQDSWHEEGWSLPGRAEDALADFGGWSPVVTAILEKATRHNRWALFARQPMARWSDGPVLLLGDAAHPMLPSLAQGAVQALEDGAMLVHLLKQGVALPDLGAAYYVKRIRRASRVQKASRDNLRLFHKRGALQQGLNYGPIWLGSRIAPSLGHRRMDWLYGAEV